MGRQLRLDRIGAPTAGSTAQQVGDRDAQSLAGFDVVIAGEVRIRDQEHTRTSGSAVGFIKFYRGAREQPAELHFQKRKTRRKSGVTVTASQSDSTGVTHRFDRKP